jgi:hypothetical protein
MSDIDQQQVGGTHYATPQEKLHLQHWNVVIAYQIPYLPATATKYLWRWAKKNGIEDLKKSKHYVQKMIETYPCQALVKPISLEFVQDLKNEHKWDIYTAVAVRYVIGPHNLGGDLVVLGNALGVIDKLIAEELVKAHREAIIRQLHPFPGEDEVQPTASQLHPS